MYDLAVIGSLNKSKILGAKRALRLLGVRKIETINVQGLKPQPIGFSEIFEGAFKRAYIAWKKYEQGLGVGIEAGIIDLYGYAFSGQIAVLTDGKHYSFGFSSFFPLPKHVRDSIEEGRELRHVMVKESGIRFIAETIGAVGYYSSGYMTRVELSFQAVLAALLPWLNRGKYNGLKRIEEVEEILKTL